MLTDSQEVNQRRAERPPALPLGEDSNHVEIRSDVASSQSYQHHSSSSSSSLDPYYFTSRLPPLPSITPELNRSPSKRSLRQGSGPTQEPVTPGKDPASIDRKALVGVGDLATPRWSTRLEYSQKAHWEGKGTGVDEVDEEFEPVFEPVESPQNDLDRSSPWTIEAVDDTDQTDENAYLVPGSPLGVAPSSAQASHFSHQQRAVRPQKSIEESAGEEILYPRSINKHPSSSPKSKQSESATTAYPLGHGHWKEGTTDSSSSIPPSSFSSAPRARKRTSDEFYLDQAGTLISKTTGSTTSPSGRKEDRRRSLGAGVISSKDRERIRERRMKDHVAMSLSGLPNKSGSSSGKERDRSHLRRSSASATSSSSAQGQLQEIVHSRRTHDFSHLPPSPSSNAIQHLIKSPAPNGSAPHSPPASKEPTSIVAHSLLRGTQEGWSALDDSATAEALRKLDGISGRSLRARSSIVSVASKSSSRPGTPGNKGSQWEGVESSSGLRRRGSQHRNNAGPFDSSQSFHDPHHDLPEIIDTEASASSASHRKAAASNTSVRSSAGISPVKRSSGGSTNFTGTPTTASRDSTSLSASTSATSVSNRHSIGNGKLRRSNSTGSDVSSAHSEKDRVASLATGEPLDGSAMAIPPVPPLPEAFKSPMASVQNFPSEDPDRTIVIPTIEMSSPGRAGTQSTGNQQRTPSKKWSFSALKLGLPSSSSKDSSQGPLSPLSPRAVSSGKQVPPNSSSFYKDMARFSSSVERLPSSPSVSSLVVPQSPASPGLLSRVTSQSRTSPEKSSRPGTSSSTNHQALGPPPPIPVSPSRRASTHKRLTPSAIPFFRRSSSQSMHISPKSSSIAPSSPTMPVVTQVSSTPSQSLARLTPPDMTSSPGSTSATRRPSVFSSLLKGSTSRKSGHSDKSDTGARERLLQERKEREREREREKEREKEEKERRKREDKERSESRISVLMGRKRGKTLSSTDAQKTKPPASLPPMQVSALPAATTQRIASLRSSTRGSNASSSPPAPTTPRKEREKPESSSASTGSARTTAASVTTKSSDISLRSSRQQLPTIAGSPSVSTGGSKDASLGSVSGAGMIKETPTKIPRISSSRASIGGGTSPQPSFKSSLLGSRRLSSNVVTANGDQSQNGEFGVLDSNSKSQQSSATPRQSMRTSPQSTSKPRNSIISSSASTSSVRKPPRESLSFSGLRKSSTTSVSSINSSMTGTAAGNETTASNSRLSILSPAKSIKLLSPKVSLQAARVTAPSTSPALNTASSSSSGRQSISTPSPVPSYVDEEEMLGDEEMMEYIKRQQARKLANGAKKEELDELLKFPEPLPPVPASSPSSILKSSQSVHLSDYERKEILDYPNVYFYGANSEKKQATRDNSTNNYSYDDDRGDYLVVLRDHLAYRYEVIDTLGKGSFGQVLQCRDHCTGESVAIKIIRNKKRFHHQALVEIKILDSLRKWDPDEKHHVIKMTEHFYFRNHLCIAMELLSINLYELIKANGFVGFTTTLIRRFTSQMLGALALMRHHRIVHCDLKPENVLLRHPAKSGIKVIDFGSSCLEHEKVYTYIQSRFYRSPEVILGLPYNMAIDMWSLGCILAELFTGFPIFPGENEQEQLACIMEVLGLPDKDLIQKSSRRKLFFDSTGAPRPVVNSKGRRRRPGTKSLAQVLRCEDPEFVDFIARCLIWDPERRLKPHSAMKHPFMAAGRSKFMKPPATPSTSSRSLLASSTSSARLSKANSSISGLETPKKVIGPPTPLTARTRLSVASGMTPSNSTSGGLSSSRSHRYTLHGTSSKSST